MSGYMYYCETCNKLFKTNGTGKKVKCPKCGHILSDLQISDEEYAALDKNSKDILKKRVIENADNDEVVSEHESALKKVNTASPNNVAAAKNSKELKRAAGITSEQHSAFNNSYLKTQIQAQILSADNFVSICKMSALKNVSD